MSTVTLTTEGILAFLPVIITAGAATLGMLGIAIKRDHFWNTTLMVVGLNAALIATLWIWHNMHAQPVTALFMVDAYACFYMSIILVATLACTTLAYAYMGTHPGNREELYLLALLSASGALALVSSRHLVGMFISLEIMSVPIYGMVAYSFQRSRSLEAGIKYLVLSAVATTFLLFGMALLYAETGQLSYTGIQLALSAKSELPMLVIVGFAMMLVTFAFKLSLVPFHLWTADVYEGAPVPVTAFLATVSKIAVLAAFLRLLQSIPALNTDGVRLVLALMAGMSIIGGNLLALMQTNIKRLLGFSSIAHLGYLLIIFVAAQNMQPAVAVYAFAYTVTTIAAFGVIAYVSSPYRGEDVADLNDYQGLFWKQPYPAAVLTVALFSLAGIPLTAGFIGKFYVILLGVKAAQWPLLGMLALGTVIGLYFYLRVMGTMYLGMAEHSRSKTWLGWSDTASSTVLILAGMLIVLIGAYPQLLLKLVSVSASLTQ